MVRIILHSINSNRVVSTDAYGQVMDDSVTRPHKPVFLINFEEQMSGNDNNNPRCDNYYFFMFENIPI